MKAILRSLMGRPAESRGPAPAAPLIPVEPVSKPAMASSHPLAPPALPGEPPRTGAAASDHSENFWATREQANPAYIEGYWNARLKPAHTEIAKAVGALEARRVLEIGAHCGPNLWAIGQQRSFDWLVGIDISRSVVEAGQRLLARTLTVPHALHVTNGDDLPYADDSFDVVLAGVVLVCVGPDKIERVLREMCRVSRRYLVLAEPFSDAPELATLDGQIDPYPNTTYWIRNYAGLVARLHPGSEQVALTHLAEVDRQGHLDAVQTIRLSKP